VYDRGVRAVVLVLAMTGVASAQAPGEVAPQPTATVMARRWSVAASIGGESLTAKMDGAPPVGFGMLELAGRFRLRPAIEFALDLGLGGNQGISTAGIYLSFRYRFLAERPWNPYALFDLGVTSAADKTGTDTEKKGRGSFRIGGGIERRIGNFGIEATLRLSGIAENTKVLDVQTRGQQLARYGCSGAELVIGGSYYF
jgi:hypothetical protein